MAFDGVVTKAIISEMNTVLEGAKVNKILEPTKNEIIIETYNNGEKHFLLLSINPENCRLCLTAHLKSNPQNAYNFCMLLRKYLLGSKILSVTNYDLERTVEIKFEAYNEFNDLVKRRLYIEIMSRQSNIVLTNENGIIIDALKHFDTGNRTMLPAHHFEFAPILKISFIDIENFEEFYELLYQNQEVSISKQLPDIFIGFSKTLIKRCLEVLNIDDHKYSIEDLERLYDYLKSIIENINTEKISCMQYEKDYTIAFEKKNGKLQVNRFVDDYYYHKETNAVFINSKNNLLRVISNSLKKVYKKIENINQKLKECEDMEKYKIYGELLIANLYRLDNDKNLDEVEVFNYYTNENIIIKLDSRISISKNVDKFFKKYNKLKNTLSIVSVQKQEAMKEMDYIESIIFSLDNAKTMDDIDEIYQEVSENLIVKKEKSSQSKKEQKEGNIPEPIDILGYKVYVGKNNMQNNNLTLKFAKSNDIWFHAQKIHGSHVILRVENSNEDIPKDVLYECAKLAMKNSKAKNATNVPVDYCLIKFVKRAQNGKPGMVNYTNYSTIIVKNS